MSAPSSSSSPVDCLAAKVKAIATPYHIVLAVVIGAITAGFGALVAVLLLIATNFNVLSLIE